MSAKGWLVSPRFDLLVFAGPAVVTLVLVGLEGLLAPTGETSVPFWVLAIVCVDVGHVWSTIYRTYLDPAELRRRPFLYIAAPVGVYLAGVALYSVSSMTFWTVLAYAAVFHFVRQQYGWVVLYNRRARDDAPVDRWIDTAVIYACTVFPIVWWHAHLPRGFEWFLTGDFIVGLVPPSVLTLGWLIYVASGVAFIGRQLQRWRGEGIVRWGKINIVATTAACGAWASSPPTPTGRSP